ncbi:MAG TPA: alcohol dehydrogenase catalytic domain-containing protein [Dehalococcoidia bacterium]|nr:alcohol dehydrogenase catalytic domain-containing protein [Dehalococcoidia bacterium]
MSSQTMQAAVLAAPGKIEVKKLPLPQPGPGEVLLRVRACGICGSDLHFYHGVLPARPGVPLGHEFAGEVAGLGPGVEGWQQGQHVAVEPVVVCQRCQYCMRGDRRLCQQRRLMGALIPGGMAEYIAVPAYTLHPLPADLDFRLAALLEPLSVVGHALHLAGLQANERVLVLGSGSIGLLASVVASSQGAEVTCTYRYPHQGEAALALGVAEAISADDEGSRRLNLKARESPFDLIVESVGGSGDTFQQAVGLARPGGRVALLGLFARPVNVSIFSLMMKEVRLLASSGYCHSGQDSDFSVSLALLQTQPDQFLRLATHTFPLSRAADAFATATDKRQGSLKVQLEL